VKTPLYLFFLSQAYPTRAKRPDRGAPFSRPLAPFSVGSGGASVTWAQVGDSVARGASVAWWRVGEMYAHEHHGAVWDAGERQAWQAAREACGTGCARAQSSGGIGHVGASAVAWVSRGERHRARAAASATCVHTRFQSSVLGFLSMTTRSSSAAGPGCATGTERAAPSATRTQSPWWWCCVLRRWHSSRACHM
jgi:hypothetical protein